MGIDSKSGELENIYREIIHFTIATGNAGEKIG